jgi:hypothetical protein
MGLNPCGNASVQYDPLVSEIVEKDYKQGSLAA